MNMRWFAGRKAEAVQGIEIRGDDEFLVRTKDALSILHCAPHFGVVQANLAVIRQGKRSGMRVWGAKPVFVVGAATWKHSRLWYAGAIAHDAYHAMLYREAKGGGAGTEPNADAWAGPEAERQCLGFQKQILAHLGAGEDTIAYIEQWAQRPTYQGETKGWRSWLDYAQRWW
jgi:hypothetical protein